MESVIAEVSLSLFNDEKRLMEKKEFPESLDQEKVFVRLTANHIWSGEKTSAKLVLVLGAAVAQHSNAQ